MPTDRRHVLNVAGFVSMLANVRAAWNVSAYSAPPFSAYIAGLDIGGDGTSSDLLPGTTVNAFNRGLGARDLARLVNAYNQYYAGRMTAGGQVAPYISLQPGYRLNDAFFSA